MAADFERGRTSGTRLGYAARKRIGRERLIETMNAMLVRAGFALLIFGSVTTPVNAQSTTKGSGHDYPTKPIRMLVGFPVGGGADVAARVLGPRMSEGLGQPIIVDNRP